MPSASVAALVAARCRDSASAGQHAEAGNRQQQRAGENQQPADGLAHGASVVAASAYVQPTVATKATSAKPRSMSKTRSAVCRRCRQQAARDCAGGERHDRQTTMIGEPIPALQYDDDQEESTANSSAIAPSIDRFVSGFSPNSTRKGGL